MGMTLDSVLTALVVCYATSYVLFVVAKSRKRAKFAALRRPGTSEEVLKKFPEGPTRDLFYVFEGNAWINFGKILGLADVEVSKFDAKDGVECRMKVTDYLCKTDPTTGDKHLPCSVIMALFDEISSLAQVFQDKTNRHGVSVSLYTEILETCGPGDTVRFVSSTVKSGKSLAFIDMMMFNQNGKLMAVGKHMKYVSQDSWAMWLNNKFLWKAFSVLLMKAPDAQKDKKGPEMAHIQDYFQVQGIRHIGDSTVLADFDVEKHHHNFFGNLHGGAVAVLAEKVATENLRLKGQQSLPHIKSMKVSYMSPVRDSITVRASALSPTHTVVDFSGGDFITTTCHINWDRPLQARL